MTATVALGAGQYLEVKEKPNPEDTPREQLTAVCVKVDSVQESSNIVMAVTNEYFAGIPFEARHLYNNHGDTPMQTKPCIPVPLKVTADDVTVDVEVIDVLKNGQPEYFRNIKCIDLADADKKGKKIKKDIFKDKPCTIKIKDKAK